MSLTTPSRSNDFQVSTDTRLSVALWNAAVGAAFRELDELGALKASVEQAIADAANANLDAVLQGQLASRLTTTRTAFESLETAIRLAQDQLVAIQTGIVLASSVRITAGGMFTDTIAVQDAIEVLSGALDDDPAFADRVADLTALAATLRTDVDTRFPTAGGRFTGAVSPKVFAHGVKGAVTEEFRFADGNVHEVTANAGGGTLTINPTGLAAGDVLQVNVLYQSGALAVAGLTQWELGGTAKGATIADVGATLTAGVSYCILFEIRAGIRTAVFQ